MQVSETETETLEKDSPLPAREWAGGRAMPGSTTCGAFAVFVQSREKYSFWCVLSVVEEVVRR